MADKTISALPAITRAADISEQSRFILEQNNTARQIQWQVLVSKLTELADGHGGIRSIVKTGTSGTVIEGQTDTYTITYADNTTSTYTVKNGARGLQGYQTYVHIRYAPTNPNDGAVSMSINPDDWIGIYTGLSESAPTTPSSYAWYRYKGEKGETGEPARVSSTDVSYQYSHAGDIVPTDTWYTEQATAKRYWENAGQTIQGNYLWTRTMFEFNDGQNSEAIYSSAYQGVDGSGLVGVVKSINGQSPDSTGAVNLSSADIGAVEAPISPSNDAVIKWDATAQKWVAGSVSTGTVKSVNSKNPNASGNVSLNTSDVVSAKSITTAMLADSAVGSEQLADSSVGATKLMSGSVFNSHIIGRAITTDKLADGSVTFDQLSHNLQTPFAVVKYEGTRMVDDSTQQKVITSIAADKLGMVTSDTLYLEGYTPVSIVNCYVYSTQSTRCSLTNLNINGQNQASVSIRYNGTSTAKPVVVFSVLFVRDEFVFSTEP